VWRIGIGAILLLALILRLKGIHNPILDHPGWRQGDTASIAKNFATLQYNILYPQTNYDGPPPNYVELELQIVPIIAATIYKIAGIHEIAGRLTGVAFSLGTVVVLAFFARWLFTDEIAGLLAALLFAIMPGSFFYARTFTPDTTMVFFMTCALYVTARMIVDDETWTMRQIILATALVALAFLAKPVSLVALVPIGALLVERAVSGRTVPWVPITCILVIPLALLAAYDRAVASHAEWHWASRITTLHVLPALAASTRNAHALNLKFGLFRQVLRMLTTTMIGPALTAFAILGFFFWPPSTRSRTLLWSWLVAGLAYTYVVVTVERVDYYMYLLLPLAALGGAGFLTRLTLAIVNRARNDVARYGAAALGLAALAAVVYQNRAIVKPYYLYNKQVYINAVTLDATLAPGALIVMGHYDPSVLYYIGRYGWEEDPYLWTPFDEQSAIRKGARYFINIEKNRFNRNLELCAWMQRFPVINPSAQWPVYVTDPVRVKPGAEKQWRAFRNAELRGLGRQWLDSQGECR
jgi:4-amino-4-deoxy-L-arabinose transferase-like glycosyltransferase